MHTQLTFNEKSIGPDLLAARAIVIEEACGTMENYLSKLSRNFFGGSKALATAQRNFFVYRG